MKDIHVICDSVAEPTVCTHHKEDSPARIKCDHTHRLKICNKLAMCMDPLNPDQQFVEVVNIVSGRVASESVNVHQAVSIGSEQMKAFEASWPSEFHETLQKKVITMAAMKNQVALGIKVVFDTSLIYSRVICLMSTRAVDAKDMFQYELAPLPTYLFHDDGTMRATTKSRLKSLLAVENSERIDKQPDAVVVDGCAVLWPIA